MKIGFVDVGQWDYHVGTVDRSALGGSQSAACYLARTLARQGQDVYYFSGTSEPGVHAGVDCRAFGQMSMADARALELDVVVGLLAAGMGVHLREIFAPGVLILWTQHAEDQAAVQALKEPAERAAYDAYALVSDWQRRGFARSFGIEPDRMFILRNAMAPSFAAMFPDGQSILAQKRAPPTLAYTSTPFRGLNLLLESWPTIRSAVPGAILQVFSSMLVYQNTRQQDESTYGHLYKLCRELDGVEYFGSIPQKELAQKLRSTTMLAYPNTFAETSCIAVMEAMASGCRIVTSDLGALPETTAGFGDLVAVSLDERQASLRRFVDTVVDVLRRQAGAPADAEDLLRRQVDYCNTHCTWDARADEWTRWLGGMTGNVERRRPRVPLAQRLGRLLGISGKVSGK